MPSAFARPDLLVSPTWLAQNHLRPDVRVLDCRWRVDGSGRRLHAEGHVPDSVYIDWATELVDVDDPLPFQLAGAGAFAQAMARAGVGSRTLCVALDDVYSLYAARVWWSMRAHGVDDVRVLDGGWPAWLDSGNPVSTAATEVEPATFTPTGTPRRRATAEEVAAIVRSRARQIIDARTPAEFLGQGGPGPRRGHIATAVNLPAALLTREGSQALPTPDALASLIAQHGVARGRPVVTYDATGVGAAKLALCLELMGFDDVAVYDGGWPDWAVRSEDGYPVES
jgi:thiosulfate/3-mercaptopyruvate sulfurtransferase